MVDDDKRRGKSCRNARLLEDPQVNVTRGGIRSCKAYVCSSISNGLGLLLQ